MTRPLVRICVAIGNQHETGGDAEQKDKALELSHWTSSGCKGSAHRKTPITTCRGTGSNGG